MFDPTDIDRQGLAAAKLGTIQADLGINKVQYATAISILFCESPQKTCEEANPRHLSAVPDPVERAHRAHSPTGHV